MLNRKLQEAAGNAGGESTYVEDVFSTYVYDGNGSSITVNNGIDLSGEGGMVWVKNRFSTPSHAIYDTARGPSTGTSSSTNKTLGSNTNSAEGLGGSVAGITSFNSNGFTTASDQISPYNITGPSSQRYVSWTWRKQAGFFDVQTYTGNGVGGRTVSHSLGSVPGVMLVKRLDAADDWFFYHRDLGGTKYLKLNTTGTTNTNSVIFNNTDPTSTEFTVGTDNGVNTNGGEYVAYLFAHDDQSFGDNSDESIIKCGSYTGNSGSQDISLGWEPQWLLVKNTTNAADWFMFDAMRGWTTIYAKSVYIRANQVNAEPAPSELGVNILPTGFNLTNNSSTNYNAGGNTYIYMAIRRPMKAPTAGTDVFAPSTTSTASTGFPADMYMAAERIGDSANWVTGFRLRGGEKYLQTQAKRSELSLGTDVDFANNESITQTYWTSGVVTYGFKRATGFFDTVVYLGTGSAGLTVNHNLGVEPELVITKKVSSNSSLGWYVWPKPVATSGAGNILLNNNSQFYASDTQFTTVPTSTQLSYGIYTDINASGQVYVASLFATVAGVSKVGSYTGTGSNVDVDCGFSAGARLVIIKRTDSNGDWYVYDSARGIVTGNDPYIFLNDSSAEVTGTDYIDPLSSGFTVTSSAPAGLNASGGTYIFLAIA